VIYWDCVPNSAGEVHISECTKESIYLQYKKDKEEINVFISSELYKIVEFAVQQVQNTKVEGSGRKV